MSHGEEAPVQINIGPLKTGGFAEPETGGQQQHPQVFVAMAGHCLPKQRDLVPSELVQLAGSPSRKRLLLAATNSLKLVMRC